MRFQKQNDGFAILIVLVAVVIVMLLYFVQADALFGPSLPRGSIGMEQRPWLLEEFIVADGEGVKIPRRPKAELNESFELDADVYREESKRGQVRIIFDTDGRITSTWDSAYLHDNRQHTLHAEMAGNIDVKQTFKDADGKKDKSRLFFIAMGSYTQAITDAETGTQTEKGTAYLIGWLDPDKTAVGHVTITTNQDWVGVYEFATEN